MEEHFEIIKNHKLFYGFKDNEIEYIFKNFKYYIKDFSDNEKIISTGTKLDYSIFLLSGETKFENYNYDGSVSILGKIKEGNLVNLSYNLNFFNIEKSNLLSCKNSTILFLDLRNLLEEEITFSNIDNKLLKNLIKLMKINEIQSEKYKIILSERSTRKKICRFLEFQKEENSTNSFDVNFSRLELADYLAVDKSSLSRELSNLKKEGLIDFNGNHFTMIDELF